MLAQNSRLFFLQYSIQFNILPPVFLLNRNTLGEDKQAHGLKYFIAIFNQIMRWFLNSTTFPKIYPGNTNNFFKILVWKFVEISIISASQKKNVSFISQYVKRRQLSYFKMRSSFVTSCFYYLSRMYFTDQVYKLQNISVWHAET